jgi:hypothetical protein
LEKLQLENMKMRTGKIQYTHLCQSGIQTIKNINQLASSSLYIFTTAAICDWISGFMLKNDVMILRVLILIKTLPSEGNYRPVCSLKKIG